jgi:polyketide synthase 12
LNFRDVLIVLGQYPEAAEPGGEGAGVVVEVGPDVRDLAVGDRVMGYMNGAFGPTAVADARLLVRVPGGWSFAEAASVPTVFATAWYGLVELGGVRAGERVLVHAGAGGVGMAAIQIARHLGAEVFATASPSKWDVLRGLGVGEDHIASSRELDFKDAFLAATGGAGVDVVLDSLAGEFVDASLELLPRGGRFIEIGKADVRDPGEVAAAYAGVEYRAFDLLEAGPERLNELLGELVELFETGALTGLPVSTWDVRRGADAFRQMREARHVGKIVLTVPQPADPEGTVLITGGTGGLGGLVARHLAQGGARRLLLASRRGIDADGAHELVGELAERGCEARVAACDVTDRGQLAKLLAAVPDLAGVVHAAGALDDATIASLDPERLHKVMGPKVDGALNLHELTRDRELSAFVLFSSAAATLGSPGQANYAAANAFLDALAHHRQTHGLPATALGWGAWEQTAGMGNDTDRARLTRLGIAPLTDEQGLALLDTATTAAQPHLVPVRLDSAALRAQAKAGVLPAVLQRLVRAPAKRTDTTGSLAQRLAEAPETDRHKIALELVQAHVANVLGHTTPNTIDPQRNFKDMGFDSLAAIELRNRLTQATNLRLPATTIFDHPTPTAIATQLVKLAVPEARQNGHGSSEEARLRELLATIPISRLREAGLLDPLTALADGAAGDDDELGASIDGMDAAELIEMTRREAEAEADDGADEFDDELATSAPGEDVR